MNARIHMIGIGADGLVTPAQRERIDSAGFLAGGARHLAFFPTAPGQRFTIQNNLDELAAELCRREGECRVVLASGDPLFYGIGAFLTDRLGSEQLLIEPALSSMQLAFARAGLSWQDAALASIHGRDVRTNLLPLLGRSKIGLFTQDGDSPAAVARFFLKHELTDYAGFVGENLGARDERLSGWRGLAELAEQRFAPLNYLILRRRLSEEERRERHRLRALVPGVADDAFTRPAHGPEVMTRQEVRSVLLGKLAGLLQAGDTVWDIGAGLGTVSVEVAVLRPEVEVLAIERDPARADVLRQNRDRFDAFNIRIIQGEAPAGLLAEPGQPRLVFMGGSGSQLDAILDLIEERLLPGGRLLANFVTLENLMTTCQRWRGRGWPTDITHLQAARGDWLGEGTGLRPLRGVYLLQADKPGVAT